MPVLVRPDARRLPSFIAALKEGYSRDTLRPETAESIAAVEADPEAFLRTQLHPPQILILPDGSTGFAVPSTVLWWTEGEEFLGSLNIRHELNETLAQVGGHVGYAVRPGARGQGHASALLAAGLDWIRANMSLRRVLLTVNPNNPHSIRVIEKNGGVHTATVPHIWREGEQALHYWIEL
ncbi:MAG TPA: GNAT family N-acetyltransferase [Phenylobacterium sp.]|nr:GNAT family N-acetyltransferase [Phenylobacterium sp.]